MSILLLRRWRLLLPCLIALAGPACAATPEADARLRAAADRGDVQAVRVALNEGARVDARDGQGRTALLVATHRNHVAAARVLIEAGARGLDEILELALAHGADLKSTNRYGGTALIPAAERGHVRTVQRLLQAGVAVDHVNNLHWTALLEAILLGDGGQAHVRIVQLLLDAGADPMLADGKGVIPLAHARQRGYTRIEALLRKAGATR